MNDLRYTYKAKTSRYILVTLILGALAGYMAWMALNNDMGLLIGNSIDLSTENATIFFWVVSALFVVGALIALKMILMNINNKREIILGESTLVSPKSGISKKIITINYSDISDLYTKTEGQLEYLVVEHVGGKLKIPHGMLENTNAFDEMANHIGSKIGA